MKAFHFTLEAVQTLRQRQEQQAMANYVHALLARQQAVTRLELLIREQLAGNEQELHRLLSAGCTASQAAQVHAYQRGLEKQQAERIAVLALAERRVHATFQGMLAARQQRKIVESYRAKQQSRHLRHELREEQKLLDDLAGRRARAVLAWNPDEGAA